MFFRIRIRFFDLTPIIVIVQHPDRVRSAGFGQKDRRPVDPPPILQLTKQGDNNTLEPVMYVH